VAAVPVGYDLLQAAGGYNTGTIEVDGGARGDAASEYEMSPRRVPGNYFSTLGVHVLAGRVFSAEDERGQTQNVVIGERMANKFWSGENPVGHRFRLWKDEPWLTVEGVVSDVGLIGPSPEARELQFYYPQRATTMDRAAGMMVRIRDGTAASTMAATLRNVVYSVNPRAAVIESRSERSILEDNLASPRFTTTLMGLFATAAVLLAAIGLYGLIAYAVGRRTHEIGVRMAMGARGADVSRMVIRDGFRLTMVGLGAGLAAALAAAQLLRSVLFRVQPTDPFVFAAITVTIGLLSLLASYLPARRAARVDPVIALRAE
jgi:putative ABC transport system permease protein